MIDLVRLHLQAGNGGNGRVSFRREKFVLKGGPDGGDGGIGGTVVLVGTLGLTTLRAFSGVKKIEAEPGQNGGDCKKYGVRGEDVEVAVPIGTAVWLLAENPVSKLRTTRYGMNQMMAKSEVHAGKYVLEKEGRPVPGREGAEIYPVEPKHYMESFELRESDEFDQKHFIKDFSGETAVKLVEITEAGQRVKICQGGFGGKGNFQFRSSTNTTPLEAEYGGFGEHKEVYLELRLLADVGLVGFPNAGKSTLLSKITKANPKVGDYPFTTVEPNLGVLSVSQWAAEGFASTHNKSRKDLVIADIPGLIEGASEGKGLGLEFLRHIENCQKLLYVLNLDEAAVYDESLTVEQKAQTAWVQYSQLREELQHYSPEMIHKPYILSLNKIDIYNKEIIDAVVDIFKQKDMEIKLFSGVTGEGLKELIQAVIA